jgi:hypothetical protein
MAVQGNRAEGTSPALLLDKGGCEQSQKNCFLKNVVVREDKARNTCRVTKGNIVIGVHSNRIPHRRLHK